MDYLLTEGLQLSHLPSILPTGIVCDAHSTLKQSFEFHRNRVFGGCLVRLCNSHYYATCIDKPLSPVHKSSTKQQAGFDTSLVEELNSIDIRTQMILKRFVIASFT